MLKTVPVKTLSHDRTWAVGLVNDFLIAATLWVQIPFKQQSVYQQQAPDPGLWGAQAPDPGLRGAGIALKGLWENLHPEVGGGQRL